MSDSLGRSVERQDLVGVEHIWMTQPVKNSPVAEVGLGDQGVELDNCGRWSKPAGTGSTEGQNVVRRRSPRRRLVVVVVGKV